MAKKLKSGSYTLNMDPKKVLDDVLNNQFVTPKITHRELTQNCLDANTTRIDVNFAYDDVEKTLDMVYDDLGIGMSHDDRENFLTKLYCSSKEGELEKRGEFGIGFKSVFRLEPDEVWVQSSKDGDDWLLLIDKDLKSEVYESEGRQGTRVTLRKKGVSQDEYETLRDEAKDTIIDFCEYSKTPIYFDGDQVTKEMDLDGLVKLHFNNNYGEGVITYSSDPSYELMNLRLGITKGEGLLEGVNQPWEILCSSKFLKTNASRNDIDRSNKTFKEVFKMLRDLEPALTLENFKVLEEVVSEKGEYVISPEHMQMIDRVVAYLDEKKFHKGGTISADAGNAKILPEVEGQHVSMYAFAKQVKEKGFVVGAYTDSVLTKKLKEKGMHVVRLSNKTPMNNYMQNFGDVIDVNEKFSMPKVVDEREFDEGEARYMKEINKMLKSTSYSSKIESVQLADFSQDKAIADQPYLVTSPFVLNAKKDSFFKKLFKKEKILLNRDHSFIKNWTDVAVADSFNAAYFTLQAVIADKVMTGKNDKIAKQLFTDIMSKYKRL